MTRHGIGTTPNIYFEDGTLAMKGGTPRIEDWPGAEVGGELSPEGVGHPPTADLSAEQGQERPCANARDRWTLRAGEVVAGPPIGSWDVEVVPAAQWEALNETWAVESRARLDEKDRAEKAEADNRALVEALEPVVVRGQLTPEARELWDAALETVSGQGEKP